MSGHSKWANIQHRKGAQDKKRAKIFTKLIREITVAARIGGGDLTANPRLRLAIDKAKSQSMPKDNIDRAIKKGLGNTEGEDYQEIRYEGYGPGGAAIIVDCMTDNKNRTVAAVRHAFSKYGGNLGSDGSVEYMFDQIGLLTYENISNEENFFDIAVELDVEDINTDDDKYIEIITSPLNLEKVSNMLQKKGFQPKNSEITIHAKNTTLLNLNQANSMIKLLEILDDIDDVQNVFSNAEFPDEILEQI
jgi:YebC/PmpR family DNA-binding regulatory protein